MLFPETPETLRSHHWCILLYSIYIPKLSYAKHTCIFNTSPCAQLYIHVHSGISGILVCVFCWGAECSCRSVAHLRLDCSTTLCVLLGGVARISLVSVLLVVLSLPNHWPDMEMWCVYVLTVQLKRREALLVCKSSIDAFLAHVHKQLASTRGY